MYDLMKYPRWTWERACDLTSRLWHFTTSLGHFVGSAMSAVWDITVRTVDKLKIWLGLKMPNAGPIIMTGAASVTFGRLISGICSRLGLLLSTSSAALSGLSLAVLLSTL